MEQHSPDDWMRKKRAHDGSLVVDRDRQQQQQQQHQAQQNGQMQVFFPQAIPFNPSPAHFDFQPPAATHLQPSYTGPGSVQWTATLPTTTACAETASLSSISQSSKRTSTSSSIVYFNPPRQSFETTFTQSSAASTKSASDKKTSYVCTSCEQTFAREWDWKHHEEAFHERWSVWLCSQCNQFFWAHSQFIQHHKVAHNCHDCKHANAAIRPRRRRTAWGCGFCRAIHQDWEQRCKHVLGHFKEGKQKSDWLHSNVIYGLLRRPELHGRWQRFVHERHSVKGTLFRWDRETTGRSNDWDLLNQKPRLQDLLEFGENPRPESEIMTVITMAYKQGLIRSSKTEMSSPTLAEIPAAQPGVDLAYPTPQPTSPSVEATSGNSPNNQSNHSSQFTNPSTEDLSIVPFHTPNNYPNRQTFMSDFSASTNLLSPSLDKELPPVPEHVSEMEVPISGPQEIIMDQPHTLFEDWSTLANSEVDHEGTLVEYPMATTAPMDQSFFQYDATLPQETFQCP